MIHVWRLLHSIITIMAEACIIRVSKGKPRGRRGPEVIEWAETVIAGSETVVDAGAAVVVVAGAEMVVAGAAVIVVAVAGAAGGVSTEHEGGRGLQCVAQHSHLHPLAGRLAPCKQDSFN